MSGKMRRNGILAAPTAMVNYVLPFALGATALGLRDEIPQIRKDAPKVARALQADVRRFEGYGLRKGFIRDPQFGGEVPGYRAKIQVDLSDLGPTYPWREMQRLNPEIELYVLLKAKPNQTGAIASFGSWNGKQRVNVVTLFVPGLIQAIRRRLSKVAPGRKQEGYAEFKSEVFNTLEHELRHFMQVALWEGIKGEKISNLSDLHKAQALGLDKLGGPENRAQPAGSAYESYLLSDVEFYPWLGEAINLAIDWAELTTQQGRKPTTAGFLEYQKSSGYLQALSRDPARYRRARQEIAAAIENWRARKQDREAWRKYASGPRVISTLLDRLDRTDVNSASALRKYRGWAENHAKIELQAYRKRTTSGA